VIVPLALINMQQNLAAAAFVLVLSAAILGWAQLLAASDRDRIGIPLALFLAPLAIPFLFWRRHTGASIPATGIMIGVAVGAVLAISFCAGFRLRAIGRRVRTRSIEAKPGQTEPGVGADSR
jgi:hypothetical protein